MCEAGIKDSLRFVVALDGSECGEWAFEEAMETLENKQLDEVHLLAVVESSESTPDAVNSATQVLKPYGKRCKELGIRNYVMVASKSPHVGAALCNYAAEKGADVLFVGRRGLSSFNRFFVGSTSRYCAEHASCTVFIAKQNDRSAE
jgi:nucleotide-binding universal stress UspA family protein